MSAIEPHLFVIFGATGDLTKRKLLPALYHLMQSEEVARHCHVLGTSRSDWSDEAFREMAREALRDAGFSEDALADWCGRRLFFQSLGEEGDAYGALHERIAQLERHFGLPGNRAFYLSLPPSAYGPTVEGLGEAGLSDSPGWTRVVIEKPFGYDLESARALNDRVHRHFEERQVYRIDHYLGKETVQNLLAFRFGNAIFESIWNRDRIERIEITVAEDLGVGGRAGYYDQSGHLRDMVQNHLTQLLTLVAMEPPATMEADAIRQEKVKVLSAVRQPDPEADVVLGQYGAGAAGGSPVSAYADEPGVPPDSDTETFVAMRLHVATWRWQGVPFYLRTGKRLPAKLTQIAVRFRPAPVSLFRPGPPRSRPRGADGTPGADGEAPRASASGENGERRATPNELIITLQPDEGFDLRFEVKAPESDGEMSLETQRLSFSYDDAFGPMPDAYETLLRDIITGDQTLFVRSDEVEASWQLYAPVLEARPPVHPYPAGTWGPDAARRLLPDWTPPTRSTVDASEAPSSE
jgi:glucose-6-phosphate 1-dehydrogenase